jgi:hypothetical protein
MLDNAASNETAVDAILGKLYPRMSMEKRAARRLRCLGHTVNLAAQTFLLGVNAEKTLDELALQQMEGDFGEMAKTWRKFGVLGKLHNTVKYIRMTSQWCQEFRRCVINKADLVKFNKLE